MKEITVYFEDLKRYKQQEIINACGCNLDFDTHPIATITVGDDVNEYYEA